MGDGFECACEPDWEGDGDCDVNTNPDLAGLVVSGGRLVPAFERALTSYDVALGVEEPEIIITATAAQPDGVVIKVGTDLAVSGQPVRPRRVVLNEAPLPIQVSVRASNGAERLYTVSATRTLTTQFQLRSTDDTGSFGRGGTDSEAPVFSGGKGIALNGSFMAVGSPAGAGVLNVYARNGSSWDHRFALHPSVQDPDGAFGTSVMVDDSWLVATAPGAGRVFAYKRSELLKFPRQEHVLAPPQPNSLSGFGKGIAMAGNTIVVGAPYEGVVPGGGAALESAGAAYVFTHEGAQWRQVARLESPTPYLLGRSERGCLSSRA